MDRPTLWEIRQGEQHCCCCGAPHPIDKDALFDFIEDLADRVIELERQLTNTLNPNT